MDLFFAILYLILSLLNGLLFIEGNLLLSFVCQIIFFILSISHIYIWKRKNH